MSVRYVDRSSRGADGGHGIDLRQFARDGIALLGHLQTAVDGGLSFADDLEPNLAEADESYAQFLNEADAIAAEFDLEPAEGEQPVHWRKSTQIASEPKLDLKLAGKLSGLQPWLPPEPRPAGLRLVTTRRVFETDARRRFMLDGTPVTGATGAVVTPPSRST